MNPGPPPRKSYTMPFCEEGIEEFAPRYRQTRVKTPVGKAANKPISLTKEQLQEFFKWCIEERGNDPKTCKERVNYLAKPLNPKNNHSVKAYRLYYHYIGVEPPKHLKVPRGGVKLDIPSDAEVVTALKKACEKDWRLCLIYRLLLESGSRVIEVLEMLNNYNISKDRKYDNHYVYELNYIRHSKKSFYIFHITPIPIDKIGGTTFTHYWVTKQAEKLGIVRAKQIRKYVSTKLSMLGASESVIDFIQGRTPTSILAKHYLNLYALALKQYQIYADWLKNQLYPQVFNQ